MSGCDVSSCSNHHVTMRRARYSPRNGQGERWKRLWVLHDVTEPLITRYGVALSLAFVCCVIILNFLRVEVNFFFLKKFVVKYT